MPHGTPDWGTFAPTSTVKISTDIAELAARLASPNVYERSGNVLLIDSFERGYTQWEKGETGGLGEQRLSAAYAHHGAYSMRLGLVAGPDDDSYIFRNLPFQTPGRFGIEASFSVNAAVTRVYVGFYLVQGVDLYYFLAGWNNTLQRAEVYTAVATWTLAQAGIGLTLGPDNWHTIKVVIDTITQKYVRLLIDNYSIDISAMAVRLAVWAGHPGLEIFAGMMETTGVGVDAYVDSIVVTQNEV